MRLPLHPRGALRARHEALPASDVFRKLGVGAQRCDLGDEGLYLAEELVRADAGWLGEAEQAQALAILVLALMIAQRQGSSRLPLDPARGPLRTLVADIARVAGLDIDLGRTVRAISNLTGAPRFNSVIGAGDARLPLIVDDGCLYTERSRWLEVRVATRLAARVRGDRARDRAVLARVLAELAAAPGTRALSAEQLRAVELALAGSLAVVTGGPGTGKTLVAAAIVRGLARLGITPIALAAQTGRAANRLSDVIAEQLVAVAASSPIDRALADAPPRAQTLHRLLGYRGHSFAHHALSPLPVGAVIVDEASLVDLELMDALLDALPVDAPLVLIGDAHQLPAIDAGQILADLAGELPMPVAVLEHSYRMDAADPRGRSILEAARAVHGDAAPRFTTTGITTPRTAGTLAFEHVELVDTSAGGRPLDISHAVAAKLWHHFDGPRLQRAANDTVFRFRDGRVDPAQASQLADLWHDLNRARILTVTRELSTGALAINAYLHQLALDAMSIDADFVPGEPVMITANDYQRGLFNGDQGVIVRADEGGAGHRFRAVFRVGGELVPFAIEALRDRLELSWAMTVHKSQGSELDAVALLLPHDDLPLLTRELLYTAISRARVGVAIAGSRHVIAAGIKRSALRHSGLARRVRAMLAT